MLARPTTLMMMPRHAILVRLDSRLHLQDIKKLELSSKWKQKFAKGNNVHLCSQHVK